MSPGIRKIFVIILIAIQVIISQAAPADDTPDTAAQPVADAAAQPVADAAAAAAAAADPQPNAAAEAQPNAAAEAQPNAAAEAQPSAAAVAPTATQGTTVAEVLADEPTTDKPANPGSKPTATKPANGATKPSVGNKPFGSCWSCLLQTVEEICSYLTDWTSPKRIPALNLFSLFQERSSEESLEDSNETPGIASFFRFRRSAEDPAKAQEAFLELLDGFYVRARERFAIENPGLAFTSLDNPFNKPNEIAQVVAYVLGVPKDRLVQAFQKMESRRTGEILLQALSDRRNALNGEDKLENKSIGGLNPTSISYFFKELLGSVNGVATGFSEIISIVLQNQDTNGQPNLVI